MSPIISGGGGSAAGGGIGGSSLIYRYVVAGADKASIDTGVDAPQAGSNDWTNGDLLEIYLVARTDEAVIQSPVNLSFNNDGGANYNYGFIDLANSTVTGGGTAAATTSFQVNVAGASAAAGVVGAWTMIVPHYAGTTFLKTVTLLGGNISGTTRSEDLETGAYLSALALTRFAITPATAAKKFKVDTTLLVYKRLLAAA